MWPRTRAVAASLTLWAGVARSAINLDGSQAVEPVGDHDPSPIYNPGTYEPDQHDCPLPCVDYTNIHSWTPYLSVDRLRRCEEPLLLQFSVTQPLDDPASTVLIRSCMLTSIGTSSPALGKVLSTSSASSEAVENPKKADKLVRTRLDSAPACLPLTPTAQNTTVQLFTDTASSANTGITAPGDVARLLEGMGGFFKAPDNCDENFLFAWHNQTAAGLYIGPGLAKGTVLSTVKALSGSLRTGWSESVADRTVAQLCGGGRRPEHTFGIAVDVTGDLAALQSTALAWSKGECAAVGGEEDLQAAGELKGATVYHVGGTLAVNETISTLNGTTNMTSPILQHRSNTPLLDKRATCRYIQIVPGDGCDTLTARCGISAADFYNYNPTLNLCSTLQPDNYVCCSPGDPYKPQPPQRDLDGTCATHLIQNGDTCDALARRYHVTVAELEAWNRGKAWGWTECAGMLLGYNMCVSDGFAPLPPPQEGASCGPTVPGTDFPKDFDRFKNALGELNPCPLKACCSNWGWCGPFPAHCEEHPAPGGGPGSKAKGFQSTCVSNCGTDVKVNGGPPAAFQRIGYYESWNMERECLWLGAKGANTDGSYTHMHWSFAEIDPNGWKVVIKDPHGQWADFKALPNMKRVVTFGGWAYSTEPATYNIIRAAILEHGEEFAANIAKFLNDEGIDGVDIDWEYPGAPDIYVNGQPIGQKGDGAGYLAFLKTLKQKVGTSKSVSIAAPAGFWYLQAFPIDQIAAVIDYIVFMTYDLHGQWDYGNVNAFDACPSGKCIRSHVNLTETYSSLSIITKAGVPNNKIFVGEASYARTFRMAQDGCWGPLCDFTGSRTVSDAKPGRCTKTGGYLSLAEIGEIIKYNGDKARQFHDESSDSDILLYGGDYMSYMTPASKEARLAAWKALNFAGTVDWAVDLQRFGEDDMREPLTPPETGVVGCIAGEDLTTNTDRLCEFTCAFGVCPTSWCLCQSTGPVPPLPDESTRNGTDIMAWDEFDVDANRLCRFACKYGYCPDTVCTDPLAEVSPDDDVVTSDKNPDDAYEIRNQNAKYCLISNDPNKWDAARAQCKIYCSPVLNGAKEDGRTTNYGCLVWQPKGAPDPWYEIIGMAGKWAKGECICDNFLVNTIADTVIEAMPAIAQISCYILMSSFKLILDIGLEFVPGVGKVLDAGIDMLATAAQMASYIYPEDQDPGGAFSWWLSPCGGTDLVPEDIQQVFDILSGLADGVSSFRKPKNIPKGSGTKGDEGNPTDRSKPKPGTGTGNNQPGQGNNKPGQNNQKPCKIKAAQQAKRLGGGRNTLRNKECDANGATKTYERIITSVHYAANAQTTQIKAHCSAKWTQACYHYSSVIRENPSWATLTCVPEAAATSKYREGSGGKATAAWANAHKGAGWTDATHRAWAKCQRDEYPPFYLLNDQSPAWTDGGTKDGQSIRYLPDKENSGAGSMWRGACFEPVVERLDDAAFIASIAAAAAAKSTKTSAPNPDYTITYAAITVDYRPEFTITAWDHAAKPLPNEGLDANPCWPSAIAPKDPGFALNTYDPWYNGQAPPYKYREAYDPGVNGV